MFKKISLFFMYFVTVFSMVSLAVVFFSETALIKNPFDSVKSVTLTGEYSVNGGDFLPLPQDGKLSVTDDNNHVLIKGHFSDDIEVNESLMMRIDNLFVTVKVNGATVYTFGDEGTYAGFSESPGNVWDSWRSTGVSTEDEVEITLSNAYTNHVSVAFSTFLTKLSVGDSGDMVMLLLRSSYRNLILGMFIAFLGIIMFILSVMLIRKKRSGEQYLLLSLFSVSAGLWFFIDFDVQSIILPFPTFNNGLDIVMLLMLQMFLLSYLASLLKTRAKNILYAPAATDALLIVVSTVTQLTGVYDYYRYTGVIETLVFIEIAAIAAAFIIEISKVGFVRVKRSIMPIAVVVAGGALDTLFYMLGIFPKTFFFKIALILYLITQFVRILKEFRDVFLVDAKVKLLEQLAYKDALTHVPNRLAYEDKCHEVNNRILSDAQEPFGLAAFDINRLKRTNDTLGHEAGDELICAAASAICHAFTHCPVYRIGGDEFAAYMNENECRHQKELIETLRALSDEYNAANPQKAPVSVAAGIALYEPKTDASFEHVMARADKAMYADKERIKSLE